MFKKITITLVALMMMASASAAEDKEVPFLFSIIAPMAIPMDADNVNGLRLNLIYGSNKNVAGVDFGLIQQITGKGDGTQIGALNIAESMDGPQFGIIGNTAKDIYGPQIAVGGNNADKITGAQLSILFNYAAELGELQFGIINRTLKLGGVQVGLFNFADKSGGTQVGLLNFANGKMIPFYYSNK